MNKKGFTLIELLAVLVVLSIVMVITVPLITTVIGDSRKNTFKISLESLVKVIKNDYQGNVRYGEVTYTLSDNTLICTSGCPEGQINIKYKGDTNDAYGTIVFNGSDIVMDIETSVYKASYKQEKCTISDFREKKQDCEVVPPAEETEKCGSDGNSCTTVESVVIEEKAE